MPDAEFCRVKIPDRIWLRLRPESAGFNLWCFGEPGHAGPHRATFGKDDWNVTTIWSDPE